MRNDLRDIRVQLALIAALLLVVDLVALGVLLSPMGHPRESEYEQLRVQRIQKTEAVAPDRGMDQKIAMASEQEAKFNEERLTDRYSAMSEEIAHIAKDAGVDASRVTYDQRNTDKNTPAGYSEVGITVVIRGTYDQDIRFINAVERQKFFLLVATVSFGGMHGDNLAVSLHLSTFMRSEA